MECKGLEIRPIRGGYMLTNQSEGARNSTNQSLPPECNAHARYPSEGIKDTGPSFLLISFCDTYPTPRLFGKES